MKTENIEITAAQDYSEVNCKGLSRFEKHLAEMAFIAGMRHQQPAPALTEEQMEYFIKLIDAEHNRLVGYLDFAMNGLKEEPECSEYYKGRIKLFEDKITQNQRHRENLSAVLQKHATAPVSKETVKLKCWCCGEPFIKDTDLDATGSIYNHSNESFCTYCHEGLEDEQKYGGGR